MTAASGRQAARAIRTPAVRAAGLTFLVLLLVAPAVFEPHSVTSIDSAVKAAQAAELARSGYRSMAISYPGRALDPEEHFYPFEPPFVFLSAGRWQSVFSSFYAVVGALPVHLAGMAGLVALSLLGGVLTAAAAARLPEAATTGALLAVFATPIWSYSLAPAETSLALAFATASVATAAGGRGRAADWGSGVLLGVAALFRDESLLMAPGVLYARHLAGGSVRGLLHVVAGIALPVGLMAAVDQWWFQRPMLAHLRHAVPGFDALLPRARARLPALEVMGWHDRLVTVVEYWLSGISLRATAVAAACVAAAHLPWRGAPLLVAGAVTAAAAAHVVELTGLIGEPRIVAGLFRLAPFLLLALLPRAGRAPASGLMKTTWVAAACYMAVTALTLNTEGGKPTGPRLTIALWPLLAVTAFDVLRSYAAAAARSRLDMVTTAAGAVLVLGSLLMEAAVVLPARAGRVADNEEAARVVRAIDDRVIVVDSIFEVDVLTALHFRRAVMRVHAWQVESFARAMAAQGVDRFTLVARPPGYLRAFPGYSRAEAWTPGRHVISRWVRDRPAPP